MKKTGILLALIIWGLSLSAQVSLENTTSLTCPTDQSYTHSFVYKNLYNSNISKYIIFNDKENSIKIFNLDHTLYKLCSITLPADWDVYFQSVGYSSQKLFNDDENVEFIMTHHIKIDSKIISHSILYDENGTILYDFGELRIVNSYEANNQFYLTANITDKTDVTNKFSFKTYLLGGTPNSSGSNNEGISEEITELKKKISTLEGSLATINEEQALQNNAITEIQEKNKTYSENISDLQAKVSAQEASLTTINEEQVIQNANIANIEKGVKTNEEDISTLQEDVIQLKDDVANIQHNINDINGTTTSIDPTKQNLQFSSYPNPAKDYINIGYQLTDDSKTIMNIYNAKGQAIEQKQLDKNENTFRLDVSAYKSGMYLYEYNGVSNKFIVN